MEKDSLEERVAGMVSGSLGCIWPFVLIVWLAIL
jgi:hypothetical protein